MFIRSLDLDNFRNYERLHIDFSEGTTILYGDNAQGKTNILEAISLASQNKSHRSSRDREMIRFSSEEAHIKMLAEKENAEYRIDLHLKTSGNKGIAVNSVPVRKTRDFLGIIHCVLFSPEDLYIVKEGPQERRRFIDTELCQLDRIYLSDFLQYRKALEQRNQLLKDIAFEPSLYDTLDVWDEQLSSYGSEIIKRRELFIREISEITEPVHAHISGGKEKLRLFYEANVSAEEMREKLREARERDLKARTTTVGPHRDDILFELNGTDARIYGSQGQQRSAALSLKLAEIELVKKRTGESPVLLLDDVMSELDAGRQKYLLDYIRDIQTVITCTGLEDFVKNRFETDLVYRVSEGRIEEIKGE